MRKYIALGLVLLSAWMLTVNMVTSRAGSASTPSLADMQRIVGAPAKCTYTASGETKALCGGRLVSSGIRVYHKAPGRHSIEYVTGPLRGVVVVSDGKHTWRWDPKCNSVTAAESVPAQSVTQLRLMLKNHDIEQTRDGTVAGKPATLLVVRTMTGAIRKRLWLDEKTYIVLKSEEYSTGGKLLSSTAFKTINYKAAVADSLFRQPDDMNVGRNAGKALTRDELSKAVGFKVLIPRYVPRSFKLDAYRLYDCPCGCGHKSAYIRYTNGMDSISVFETAAGTGCMKMSGCIMPGGQCGVKNQTAMMTTGGRTFIVIGDVPSQELKRITNSLR